jgi:hypothetical protein
MRIKRQQSRIRSNKLGSRRQTVAAFITDIAPAIVATLIVLYSLFALYSGEINRDNTSTPILSNEERVAGVGLRFVLGR